MSLLPWHEPAFEALLKRKERLPHALLIRGPQGIGKLAFAEALSRALLCESPGSGGVACGKCSACAWMGQGSHPDFRRLEPEGPGNAGESEEGSKSDRKASLQISVDQVRAIADFINISSHRGGAKVVLIHPAEMLNVSAANALLKNLEEPPPNTYFLLVAHRWHQLLPTIRSRCEQIALPSPTPAAARAWLEEQALQDADLALAQAGGAPLLALQFDEEYWRQRETLLSAITSPEPNALHIAEQLRDSAPERVVGWLQRWSFDLAWHKVTGGVRYNPDRAADVAAIAARLNLVETLRFQRDMVKLQRIASHPLNARLFYEQLLLNYAALIRGQPSGAAGG